MLELSPFLGGTQASFADYSVFGAMMWARITSSFDILEDDQLLIGVNVCLIYMMD